ncbi:MAG: GNAT family N-acetyltransferase [Alphaproteobacteria bacterium]|nr:GNAT family N-acetyltransferase [Alphaproteobacteria bacterium]
MNVTIQNAAVSDLDRIVALNDQVQRQHADAYPNDFVFPINPTEVSDFFAALLDDGSQALLLALADGDAIGYLWYQIQHRPPNPFTRSISRTFIHHVVVDQRFRR